MMKAESKNRVWLAGLCAVFLVLCVAQNVALPIFEAPDEGAHFYYAAYLADHASLPALTHDADTHEVFQPPLYYAVLAPPISFFDLSRLPEINLRNRDWWDTPGVVNQYVHYSDAETFPYAGEVWAVRVARFISSLMGIAVVVFVYLIAQMILPSRREGPGVGVAPLLSAAFVALNPKFIHIASIVNNDIAVILASTIACWWMVVIQRPERFNRSGRLDFFILGALIGIAGLCKVSGLGLLAPAGIVILFASPPRGRGWGWAVLRNSLFLLMGLLLTHGWWFWRNFVTYGDPLASALVQAANAPLARPTPLGLGEMIALVPRLITSYWGALGINLELPAWMNVFYLFGAVMAGIGLGLFEFRPPPAPPARRGAAKLPAHWEGLRVGLRSLLPLAVWQIVVIASFIPWLRGVTDTENSRLLMPAIAFVAVCAGAGWARIFSGQTVLTGLTAFAILVAIAVPYTVIAPAFAYPIPQPGATQKPVAVFGGRIALRHAEVTTREVKPGDVARVVVDWELINQSNFSMRILAEAVDADGNVLGRVEAVPFGGRFATNRWAYNAVYRDEYAIPIRQNAPRGVAELRLGWLSPYENNLALKVDGANTNRFVADKIKIAGADSSASQQVAPFGAGATFGDQIHLDGAELKDNTLTLAFVAQKQPQKDYTLFVHVQDASGKPIWQSDAPPHDGKYPTSFWGAGERMIERRAVELPPQTARVVIGWYDPQNMQRLAAVRGDGGAWVDNLVTVFEK